MIPVRIDFVAKKQLRKFLVDYGNNLAKKIATEVRDNLAEEYHESVALFYSQYTPKVYDRQYRLYDGFRKFYHNQHGNVFTGGIIFTDEKLGSDYSLPTDVVYDMAIHGFHGNLSIWTAPTIFDRMSTYLEILYNSIEYFI